VKLPDLPSYPDDADGWRSLDRSLAGRALDLRNRIHVSQGLIYSTAEYTEEDLEYTLTEHAARRGLEAWGLAVGLRRKHKVESVDLIWDYADALQSELVSALKTKERSLAQNATPISIELPTRDQGGPPGDGGS
jgi:hypothetical protein